jgi:hypothetical protein
MQDRHPVRLGLRLSINQFKPATATEALPELPLRARLLTLDRFRLEIAMEDRFQTPLAHL